METVQGKSGPPMGEHAGWERAGREGRVSSKICHQQYYTRGGVSVSPLSIRDYDATERKTKAEHVNSIEISPNMSANPGARANNKTHP